MYTNVVRSGLEGVIAGQTAVSEVTQTGLRYRGYDIADLAHHVCFEEVIHLLLYGELPDPQQLSALRTRLQHAMVLPTPVLRVLAELPHDTSLMDVLRTTVSLLGHYDPEADDPSRSANLRKSERLLGQSAATLAAWARRTIGAAVVEPDPRATHGANLLSMILGHRPSELAGRIFDGTMLLYAEHEFNASTFAARTIASTQSDLHAAVTGAIGALKGPLHGGANEAAMRMFLEIGGPENVETWFRDVQAYNRSHPDTKKLIMGFGHRVYKHGDHRAGILRDWAVALAKETGVTRWIETADKLEDRMLDERGIHANLDYSASHTYYQLGIPIDFYTPIFVCSRLAGWCAHVIEQHENNRLIRPQSAYVGPALRTVVPIDGRSTYDSPVEPPLASRMQDLAWTGSPAYEVAPVRDAR